MNIIKSEIKIGLTKPLPVIHASDTHITLADERDGERKMLLAKNRITHFPEQLLCAEQIMQLQKSTGCPVIYTGDFIDFVSEPNIEYAKNFCDKTDCFFAAGNHEFSLYVGEAKEDAAYRNQSLSKVQAAFKNDIRMSSRQIGEVNFVALDNSYYLFEKEQLDFLKAEAAKGFPVVLCIHNPLYTRELYDLQLAENKDEPAYLVSVPEELVAHYSAERYEQQKEDAVTHEAYEFILHENGIKAILAGHVHKEFEVKFGGKIQCGVGCTDIRLIDFV